MREIEKWWESVKDNHSWSGSIQGMPWSQIWEEAKDELKLIYDSAREPLDNQILEMGEQLDALNE